MLVAVFSKLAACSSVRRDRSALPAISFAAVLIASTAVFTVTIGLDDGLQGGIDAFTILRKSPRCLLSIGADHPPVPGGFSQHLCSALSAFILPRTCSMASLI